MKYDELLAAMIGGTYNPLTCRLSSHNFLDVTIEDVQNHISNLFSEAKIDIMVVGNFQIEVCRSSIVADGDLIEIHRMHCTCTTWSKQLSVAKMYLLAKSQIVGHSYRWERVMSATKLSGTLMK
jgi:hypothetical protein